ncbi:MAG: basic rane protein [Solirubrobacteraceae bacterium]|jgi:basic membrane lipoprotein Med (substrate-binding protein (PBP1-ABC) superfamily)|nr:basic rane protein [Solirubrobacteraceae bacterium]
MQRLRGAGSRTALLVVCTALAIAGCGGGSDSGGSGSGGSGGADDSSAKAASDKQLKVGLILYAPKNAEGWPQAGYEAAKRLADEGLIKLSVVENVAQNSNAVTQVATRMADDGTDLIIAHSGTWGQAIQDLSQRYPDVNFAWTGTDVKGDNRENVAAVPFPLYQAAYLAGVLAGGVSKSGVVGGVAGFDIPVCHAMLTAFQRGAAKTQPNTKMLPSYVGSWTDPSKTKEAVFASADQGADVFLPCGAEPGTISGAKDRNSSVFGYIVDESSMAPKAMIGSLLWDPYVPFKRIVDDIRSEQFRPGKTYTGGISDGTVSIKLNPQYGGKIPAAALAEVKRVEADIKADKFTVPYVPK